MLQASKVRALPFTFLSCCFPQLGRISAGLTPARLGVATQAFGAAVSVFLCSLIRPTTAFNGVSACLVPPPTHQIPLSPLSSLSSWPYITLRSLIITLGIVECNISPFGEIAGPPMVSAVQRHISRTRGTTRIGFVARLLSVAFIFSCVCVYLIAKMRTFEWVVLGLGAVSGVQALTPE